jgi:cysteinyl-tRNA synthetase
MPLRIYNSLTREREEFQPLNPPHVGVYVCGPTVYGHSHLGHAKSYVSFDAIVRWLRFSGYNVTYIQNITDVGHLTDDADSGEDKVIAEARRRGLHPMAVVESFTHSYLEDMDALGNARPDIMPRATGHIPEQIALVQKLIETGHAYESGGSVYFDVSSFKEYGKLSGRSVDEMEAGARVAINSAKRHPADFAVWIHADPGHLMKWPSPWGDGYPGWHVECSAMSQKYLGDTLDIHGGGMENKFPHHECEIAQSEAATSMPFVRYWMHNNMVTLNGQKMGKSLGNAISLKQVFTEGHDLLEKTFEPVVVRHFILTSHYGQNLDFSNEALRGAESGCYKLRDAVARLSEAAGETDPALPASAESLRACIQATSEPVKAALAEIEQRFTDAMNEDFNTAQAIAVLFDFTRLTNSWIADGADQSDLQAANHLMRGYAHDVLGFNWGAEQKGDAGQADDLIGLLVDLRANARMEKNFALSDTIRDRLAEIGVELQDGPEGTTW